MLLIFLINRRSSALRDLPMMAASRERIESREISRKGSEIHVTSHMTHALDLQDGSDADEHHPCINMCSSTFKRCSSFILVTRQVK